MSFYLLPNHQMLAEARFITTLRHHSGWVRGLDRDTVAHPGKYENSKHFLFFNYVAFVWNFRLFSSLSIARRGRVTFFLLMLSSYYCLSLDSSHSSAENLHIHTDTMRFGSSLTSTQNHCSGDNKRSTRSSFERA